MDGVCIAQYGFIDSVLCNTGNRILGTKKINMKITQSLNLLVYSRTDLNVHFIVLLHVYVQQSGLLQTYSSPLKIMLFVKCRVESVEVFGIKLILNISQTLAKALKMHDLALAQKLYRVANIGIVG